MKLYKKEEKFKNLKNKKNIESLMQSEIINQIEEIKIDDIENKISEKQKFISLADKLLVSDENYLSLLKIFFDQEIYISHEDLIKDEFWEKYKFNTY